jgi:hypothetical protein
MKLHVITIAYEKPVALRGLIDSFILQTNPDWIMTIFHDGPPSLEVKRVANLYDNEKRVAFHATTGRRGNWGHDNRREGLAMQLGDPRDFVLITNGDNYYIPTFVEYMLEVIQGAIRRKEQRVGMVYCDFLHHTLGYINMISQPRLNYIDMGAFIVDLKIAQEVGFVHMDPAADGIYCEECVAKCKEKGLQVVHLSKTAFVHN